MGEPQSGLSNRGQRREQRYKDTFRGNIDYLGASYLCMVHDISQQGFHLLSGAAVDIGDRMSVKLQLSEEARFSCLIEVRHVTADGLGAKIIYIGHEDAYVLSERLDKLHSDFVVADAVQRGMSMMR
ncbi:MAG: PilZ domain-containing protein [Betaproteobacteria bacterium]